MSMKSFFAALTGLVIATLVPATRADEAAALARLERSVSSAKSLSVTKDRKTGAVIEIRVNAPDLRNDDLGLFNEIPTLRRLTISHAGYRQGGKTGVDFSGVAVLSRHPSLRYFSAGGAVGRAYLAALAKLTNITELYVQTTHSVDTDWAPIGTLHQLTYLGVRVRNDRMSKLTEGMFTPLTGLRNLEHFLVSEMTFREVAPLVKLAASCPRLKQLTLRRCQGLSAADLDSLRRAKSGLELVISDR